MIDLSQMQIKCLLRYNAAPLLKLDDCSKTAKKNVDNAA